MGIQKMRAEHKKKAGQEYAELDNSKKEEEKRKDEERIDIWGNKDGAAGAAVRNTVEVEVDEAKAAEEEKIHDAKTSERDGKTKRDAKLVKEAGAERSTKTEREHRIEVEEKKLRADKQELGRKEAAEKKTEANAKSERAKKEADEKKNEKIAKAREPPCGDDQLYCKSIKEWSEILDALEKTSKSADKAREASI